MRSVFLSSQFKFATHPKEQTEKPQTEPFPLRGKSLNLCKAALAGGNWNSSLCACKAQGRVGCVSRSRAPRPGGTRSGGSSSGCAFLLGWFERASGFLVPERKDLSGWELVFEGRVYCSVCFVFNWSTAVLGERADLPASCRFNHSHLGAAGAAAPGAQGPAPGMGTLGTLGDMGDVPELPAAAAQCPGGGFRCREPGDPERPTANLDLVLKQTINFTASWILNQIYQNELLSAGSSEIRAAFSSRAYFPRHKNRTKGGSNWDST